MKAGQCDLYIERGADFIRELILYKANGSPINLTGANVMMQIRENAQSSNVICTPQVSIIDAVKGKAKIYISYIETAKLPAFGQYYDKTTDYVYDVFIQHPSTPIRRDRILNGRIKVSPEVTK